MSIAKRLAGFPAWLFLGFIGFLVFVPFIGNVHLFDWDEINFAESAREMLLTHCYRMVQINFQPFYDKPPFYIWLQALSMSYFGVNEFAARFPNAVIGIVTMITVYQAGKRYFDADFGIWWALLFACSILPQAYFKSGIIDPVFNYFIFLSLYLLFTISIKDDFESSKMRKKNHRWFLVVSALAAGAAVLTKGPVALGLIVITVSIVLTLNKGKLNVNFTDLVIWLAVVATIIGIWLSFEIRANGIGYIRGFIAYQVHLFTTEETGYKAPFYFHFLGALIGCFPASVLCLDAFRKNYDDTLHQVSFKRWMIVLLLVVLFVFSAVRTKIIYYSSLCYFPVTFLGAYYIHHLISGRWRWTWRQSVPMAVIGGGYGIAVAVMIWLGVHNLTVKFFGQDRFAADALTAPVFWAQKEIIIPVLFLVALAAGLILMYRKQLTSGLATILISTCLFTNLMLALIVPRVEKYSQAAMIEFIESKKMEDCYIEVHGFKSYAQLYYLDKKEPDNKMELDQNYLLRGPVKKPLYLISRVNKLNDLPTPENFEELYRKNGYVFFKRKK